MQLYHTLLTLQADGGDQSAGDRDDVECHGIVAVGIRQLDSSRYR